MGVWIKSSVGNTVQVRDGFTQDDPMLFVGVEPVYFKNSNAGRFVGDRELEIVAHKAAPTAKEQKAQNAEQAKLREAADAKQAARAAAAVPRRQPPNHAMAPGGATATSAPNEANENDVEDEGTDDDVEGAIG